MSRPARRSPGCRRRRSCSTARGSRARIEVDLAPDARLFLAEAIVFGRSGMGEAVEEGALFDRWRVRRGGKLIYAEERAARRADRAAACRAGCRQRRRRGRDRADRAGRRRGVAAVRALQDQFIRRGRRVGLERHRGGAPVRADGAALRRDLVHVMTRCAANCRASGPIDGTIDESDAARKGQAADLGRRDGGAPAARARRQAQSPGSGRADHRFHSGRRARRPARSPS